jgi:hypothetical protein
LFLTENLGGTRGLVPQEVPQCVQGEVLELEVADKEVEAALIGLSDFLLLLVHDFVDQVVHLQSLLGFLAEQITLEKKLDKVLEDLYDVFDELVGDVFVRRKLGDILREDLPEVEVGLAEDFVKVSYVDSL